MPTATLNPRKATASPHVVSHLPMLREVIDDLDDEQIAFFTNISWQDYQDAMDHREILRPGIRIFYDRGAMEIMATSYRHERWKLLLGMIVAALSVSLKRRMQPAGGMTVSRKDMKKGFEPDECYYFGNVDRILGKDDDLDFNVDPPPDLAVEVERSRSAIGKLSVYASFGVPEIWRFNGTRFVVLRLGADGKYSEASSGIFPELDINETVPLIQDNFGAEYTQTRLRIETWVADRLKSVAPDS